MRAGCGRRTPAFQSIHPADQQQQLAPGAPSVSLAVSGCERVAAAMNAMDGHTTSSLCVCGLFAHGDDHHQRPPTA